MPRGGKKIKQSIFSFQNCVKLMVILKNCPQYFPKSSFPKDNSENVVATE